jgi:aconitase A
VTEILRKRGVVGKFVEFFGPGLPALSLADRATIANMAPEYGATMGFFPVDEETLAYLRLSGRDDGQVRLVEAYFRAQGLFRTGDAPEPEFTDVLELDLATVESSIAGPKRPQDRIPVSKAKAAWQTALADYTKNGDARKHRARRVADGSVGSPSRTCPHWRALPGAAILLPTARPYRGTSLAGDSVPYRNKRTKPDIEDFSPFPRPRLKCSARISARH